jgi:putative phosphoribosyl transferase
VDEREVHFPAGGVRLRGTLTVPEASAAAVIFAHGSGSSRLSPRNRQVAGAIQDAGIATLLFDLLTAEEEAEDRYTGHLRFDIELLAGRLAEATDWLVTRSDPRGLTIGYFGASTGAAAALIAAARLEERVSAVVSRGGRPDLAGPYRSSTPSASRASFSGSKNGGGCRRRSSTSGCSARSASSTAPRPSA